MPQILKDDVKERIIESAKREFLKNGVEKASMRSIADDSHMTVGNLYRYFKNKDALNECIVKATLDEIDRMVREKSNNMVSMSSNEFDICLTVDQYKQILDELADDMMDIYSRHKTEFNILMMHSKLNDQITDWFTGLISNIIRGTYRVEFQATYQGEPAANEFFTEKYLSTLSHGYAVSIFSGLRDIFKNAKVSDDALKSMVKIYFRSYINSLTANLVDYIGE